MPPRRFCFGHELHTWESYGAGLLATVAGALVLALTRSRERRVSQEAVIGVVYAASAAGAVLLADRAAHGVEHIRAMLVGSLLTVSGGDVVKVAILYALIGALHWLCRRPFFLISMNASRAYTEGWRVRLWDFVFYASFGVVVTSSVRIAGVLLVFSYLIVPALAATLVGGSLATRLLVGWAFGAAVSVLGVTTSAWLDLPDGRDDRVRLRREPGRALGHGARDPAPLIHWMALVAVLAAPGARAAAERSAETASRPARGAAGCPGRWGTRRSS